MPQWIWIGLGGMAIAGLVEARGVYWVHHEAAKSTKSLSKEEIFQVVNENAADLIALFDVKGQRLYNSPSYKQVLGYSPAELSETSSCEPLHPDDRRRVLEAAREARESGWSGGNTASSTKTAAGACGSRWRARSAMPKTERERNEPHHCPKHTQEHRSFGPQIARPSG